MRSPHRAAELQVAGELDERARCLLAAARTLVKDPAALVRATLIAGNAKEGARQLMQWGRDLEHLAETCEEFSRVLRTPTIGEFIEDGKLRRLLGLLTTGE
jgi:hypothetical protein